MGGIGFWKKDYMILENEDHNNVENEVDHDDNLAIVELEDMIVKLYDTINGIRDYHNVDMFDDLSLLSLRDWLSNYIPDMKKCFNPDY